MSAVLRLLQQRANSTARIELPCAEGTLVLEWNRGLDTHEKAKARGGKDKTSAEVLDEVSGVIDCQGATYWVRP